MLVIDIHSPEYQLKLEFMAQTNQIPPMESSTTVAAPAEILQSSEIDNHRPVMAEDAFLADFLKRVTLPSHRKVVDFYTRSMARLDSAIEKYAAK